MGPFCAPGPAADLMVNDRNVVRFSLASQPDSTPAATLAAPTTRTTASPASIVDSGADSAPAVAPFDLEKALNLLDKLSDIELRAVMRVLQFRGRMQENMVEKRFMALVFMENQPVEEKDPEAMMDAADLASSSTPAGGRTHPGGRAPALSPSGALAPVAALPGPAGPLPALRGTAGSNNDVARLSHDATDSCHFNALQADSQPLARVEFEKQRGCLWETVLAPAFSKPRPQARGCDSSGRRADV